MLVSPNAALRQRQGYVARPSSLPAPVGGLNTRDAPSAMSPTDALIMDNGFPSENGVESRKGYEVYATGLNADVQTLAEYHVGSTRKFIAAASSKIYDISGGGAAVELASGYTSAKWQTVYFNGYLFLVNGADTPQKYDGSAVTATSFSGTGLTVANLNGVTAYRNRLYFWENNSQDFWYGGVNSISGTLTKFPLSLVGRVGGNLVSIKTISRDGGSGFDDYIAFFMTSGEVFINQGNDPGDPDNWALVGRYKIGEPIHQRAIMEYQDDVIVVTKADAIALSQVLGNAGTNTNLSKLSGAIAQAARDYQGNYGWQLINYPKGNRVLLNVPVVEGTLSWQYGMNTITNASFRFKGMNALCFGIYNNDLYFGGSGGMVFKADTGLDDNGTAIEVTIQQAFSNLGSMRRKHFLQIRPLIRVVGSVNFSLGLAFDFGNISVTRGAASSQAGTPWGSPWGSPWTPEGRTRTSIFGASGVGEFVSLKMQASLNGQMLTWHQTDFKYRDSARF